MMIDRILDDALASWAIGKLGYSNAMSNLWRITSETFLDGDSSFRVSALNSFPQKEARFQDYPFITRHIPVRWNQIGYQKNQQVSLTMYLDDDYALADRFDRLTHESFQTGDFILYLLGPGGSSSWESLSKKDELARKAEFEALGERIRYYEARNAMGKLLSPVVTALKELFRITGSETGTRHLKTALESLERMLVDDGLIRGFRDADTDLFGLRISRAFRFNGCRITDWRLNASDRSYSGSNPLSLMLTFWFESIDSIV